MSIRSFAGLLLVLLFHFAPLLYAQGVSRPAPQVTETVQTDGMAPVVAENVVNARDNAIQDALRKAVEQVAGTMIASETLVQNSQLLSDNIWSKSSGFVERYALVKEGRSADGMYTVSVSALVKKGPLEESIAALHLLIEQMRSPRIAVLMRERNMTDSWADVSVDLNIAETVLRNRFLEKSDRFKFIDRSTAQARLDKSRALAALGGDDAAAQAIGQLYSADIVVVGEAYANTSVVETFGTRVESAQATATARMIWCDTGDIIGSDIGKGAFAPVVEKVSGGRNALEKASAQLGSKLIPKIIEDWRKKAIGGDRQIAVTIRNATLSDLKNFVAALQGVTGFKNAHRREFTAGVAVYEITCKNDGNAVAEELDGKAVGAKKVGVVSVTPGSIEIRLE
ncbi:hypothetical protein HYY27_03385 [bacterium]|nr:hypothetical protein [bacterium]